MCVSGYVLLYVNLCFTEKPSKGCEINKYEYDYILKSHDRLVFRFEFGGQLF